jgi:hypothetical protein
MSHYMLVKIDLQFKFLRWWIFILRPLEVGSSIFLRNFVTHIADYLRTKVL